MTPLVRVVPLAGVLEFSVPSLVEGLGLPEADVLGHFRDGRRAQPIVVRRLLRSFEGNGWTVMATPGGGVRLVDDQARSHDVRVIVDELSLAPSFMKGTGRRFDADAFRAYYGAAEPAGVFVVDVAAFPRCPYWRFGSLIVLEWFNAGLLGANGSAGRSDLGWLLKGLAA